MTNTKSKILQFETKRLMNLQLSTGFESYHDIHSESQPCNNPVSLQKATFLTHNGHLSLKGEKGMWIFRLLLGLSDTLQRRHTQTTPQKVTRWKSAKHMPNPDSTKIMRSAGI